MSFYQTNNSSIVRFSVTPKKAVAPFSNMKRIAAISSVGAGYSGYYTGAVAGTIGVANKSFLLTPEQIQNGALIINPTGTWVSGTTNPYAHYTLPSAFALQEFLGGRGAFNIDSQITGANDFFVLNVYNLATCTGVIHAYTDGTNQKTITQATVQNDAVLTPVLIEFTGVNSSYASVNGVANYVSYTIY
uniref:Uncharacterized protein n=1 Tax=viral metagenome TaxID=1070528 RepID=A0A6C0HDM1_9ZZZZ